MRHSWCPHRPSVSTGWTGTAMAIWATPSFEPCSKVMPLTALMKMWKRHCSVTIVQQCQAVWYELLVVWKKCGMLTGAGEHGRESRRLRGFRRNEAGNNGGQLFVLRGYVQMSPQAHLMLRVWKGRPWTYSAPQDACRRHVTMFQSGQSKCNYTWIQAHDLPCNYL